MLGTPAVLTVAKTHPRNLLDSCGKKLQSITSDAGDVSLQAAREAEGHNLNKMSLFRDFLMRFFCGDKSQACAGDNNTKCLTAFLTIVWHPVCLIIVSITHTGKLL